MSTFNSNHCHQLQIIADNSVFFEQPIAVYLYFQMNLFLDFIILPLDHIDLVVPLAHIDLKVPLDHVDLTGPLAHINLIVPLDHLDLF